MSLNCLFIFFIAFTIISVWFRLLFWVSLIIFISIWLSDSNSTRFSPSLITTSITIVKAFASAARASSFPCIFIELFMIQEPSRLRITTQIPQDPSSFRQVSEFPFVQPILGEALLLLSSWVRFISTFLLVVFVSEFHQVPPYYSSLSDCPGSSSL
ncbi:uncharacterized protein LOC127091667 [Lathyrus oleraceus]|uniref:uncharacterized protein LOC127091667 n=1 Tax=Pisum sativum TaxID=3888 RepID=UPI001FC554B0|nr:uncharacterized protein LOC127091667 [Pisum sativum]